MANIITRRNTLRLAATAAAAAALGERASAQIPRADAAAPRLPLENGATLRVLRPARFVEPDETIFRANTAKFQAATGVRDARRLRRLGGYPPADCGRVEHRHRPRRRARLGRGSARLCRQADRALRPRRISRQALRRLELPRREIRQAREDQQLDRHPVRRQHRPDRLSPLRREGSGLRQDPERPRRIPEALPGAEEDQQAGRLRARQRGRRRQRLRALAGVVARRLPGRRGRQGRDQQQGDDRGAALSQGALSELHQRHA